MAPNSLVEKRARSRAGRDDVSPQGMGQVGPARRQQSRFKSNGISKRKNALSPDLKPQAKGALPLWPPSVQAWLTKIRQAGFDLVSWTSVAEYNQAVPPAFHLPEFDHSETTCFVIGNSRVFWPIFRAARLADPELLDSAHPIDRYTEKVLTQLSQQIPLRYVLRFGHTPPPQRVALQRLAHLAGLAHLGPAHLTVHQDFGPWHALRAALVLDLALPANPKPAPDPCTPCDKPCLLALKEALALDPESSVRPRYKPWLKIREVCPIAPSKRYSEGQIRYHYGHDRAALEESS